jgi:regulator of protease activity HflC (stomatin/prohibitin superfamily)
MKNRNNGNTAILSVIGIVGLMLFVYIFWMWGFCRFYVSPDKMAIITAKTGKSLPAGEILAEKGQKGVWREVLGEGRYFLNPFFYEWEIKPIIKIDVGKIGLVTAKIGKDLPAGEFLAEKGQKGIQKTVLGPGKYRFNPYGYEITIQDALQIPIGYVGVITSLSGKQVKEGEFAKLGEKGVLENVLQPGIYYINPRQYRVDILEVGTNQISLLGGKEYAPMHAEEDVLRTKSFDKLSNQLVVGSKTVQDKIEKTQEKQKLYRASVQQAIAPMEEKAMYAKKEMMLPQAAPTLTPLIQFIEFPSKDGFDIRLDMTVEFEFLPKDSASIFMNYGDLFQVVEKIILPQILSISRLKGSAYGARDYIVGEGREKFQDDLYSKLKDTLSAKGIDVLSALIRHVIVPDDIRKPIQDASIAIETNLTNIERQETAKKLAELNTEISLISQRREQVQQETQKLKAEIRATQEKEVAEIQANTIKLASEIEKQTAEVQADKTRKIAKVESDVTRMVGLAEAEGFRLKVGAFGDPNAYSLYEFTRDLPKDMKLIIAHTGAGTLWTDLDKSLAGQLGGMKVLETGNKESN